MVDGEHGWQPWQIMAQMMASEVGNDGYMFSEVNVWEWLMILARSEIDDVFLRPKFRVASNNQQYWAHFCPTLMIFRAWLTFGVLLWNMFSASFKRQNADKVFCQVLQRFAFPKDHAESTLKYDPSTTYFGVWNPINPKAPKNPIAYNLKTQPRIHTLNEP